MAFPSFDNSAWMKPCVRSTPTAFHFMTVTIDMHHHIPDKCGTCLKTSVKSPLSFDMCYPYTTSRTKVLLDRVMESGGDDPRAKKMGGHGLVAEL
jgi:hypothetical protein